MDAISSVSAASETPRLGEAANPGADRLISSDFETFLKMLTTQMENQDPLNPLNSTDFAVQLATFSGVEQQVQTNDLLRSFTSQLGLWGMSNLAGWIGREVRAAVPAAFAGAPVTLETAPDPAAARAELMVVGPDGTLADRFDIPKTGGEVSWTGVVEGETLPPGTYEFSVASYDAEGRIMSESVPQRFAPVAEVRVEDGAPMLVLTGGIALRPEEVTAVRSPE
jgi:flagellar basal-body rod modification protein FlgD